MILRLGCQDPLWRAVAPCGGLWRPVAEGCGPYILPCSVLGACRLVGWCLAGWLDAWMAGWPDGGLTEWLDGWMAGWLDGGHHSCNLARSSSRRVGGFDSNLLPTWHQLANLPKRLKNVGPLVDEGSKCTPAEQLFLLTALGIKLFLHALNI